MNLVGCAESDIAVCDLVPGHRYVFGGEKWPLDKTIERLFIGIQEVSMRNGSLSFLILQRNDGSQHLVLMDLVRMIVRA